MLCRVCNKDKLSEEFAPETLSPKCDHAALVCLRCSVKGAKVWNMCPYPGCLESTVGCEDTIASFQEIIEDMFPEYRPPETAVKPSLPKAASKSINVITMTGKSYSVGYDATMFISRFKLHVQDAVCIRPENQKLMYGDSELVELQPGSSRPADLSFFNVHPGSEIHLMIILYEVPKHFNHVVFDISWGYPNECEDYLNASCLLFTARSHRETINWKGSKQESRLAANAVVHTGDIMDPARQIGRQCVEVRLQSIPSDISHVFFSLRADRSATIEHFPNISLQFYEASNRTQNLCETKFDGQSKGIVLCYLVRKRMGGWQIVKCGQHFGGWGYMPCIRLIQTNIIPFGERYV